MSFLGRILAERRGLGDSFSYWEMTGKLALSSGVIGSIGVCVMGIGLFARVFLA